MKGTCLKLFITTLLLFAFTTFANAASLSLTNIGALSTAGATYSEWWYSGTNPTLSGTAGENATVEVNIDGNTTSVTADASGNWSTATTMDSGDHTITLTSGSESYTFTLHAGQLLPDSVGTTTTTSTTESTTAVPPTGSSQVLGFLVSFTLVAAGFYLLMVGRVGNKKSYVKSVLKSLD